MNISVIFFSTNRFEYLIPTLESFQENVSFEGHNVHKILIDDFPTERNDVEFYNLKDNYGIDHLILNRINIGLSYSIEKAWSRLPEDCDYIFHMEDDFVFNEKIKIDDLVQKFEKHKDLLFQITLKRQIWYHEGDFIERIETGEVGKEYDGLILHQYYFNLNPSLYPYWVTQEKFNHRPHESLTIGSLVKKYPNMQSSLWGKRKDPSLVHHIGDYTHGRKNLPDEPLWDSMFNVYDPKKKYYSNTYNKEWN